MSVANKMREIASNAEKQTPEEMKDIFDQIVNGIAQCARKGMFGMGLSMDFPEEMSDYLPHIVGDLRNGGFTVDIISYQPSVQGTSINFFVTW